MKKRLKLTFTIVVILVLILLVGYFIYTLKAVN